MAIDVYIYIGQGVHHDEEVRGHGVICDAQVAQVQTQAHDVVIGHELIGYKEAAQLG